MCGGTRALEWDGTAAQGLSPRVRGNRRPAGAYRLPRGSIPACAGEPSGERRRFQAWQVYPRVCGGTGVHTGVVGKVTGLSPRVRGNPRHPGAGVPAARSIPACAGEPRPIRSCRARTGVYPRVCGGTIEAARPACTWSGLSPRVRGNREPVRIQDFFARSIPACAGEPCTGPRSAPAPRVYPRVCGGTAGRIIFGLCRQGLSPRVRGNRRRLRLRPPAPGSIPACAGEPRGLRPGEGVEQVYPRVCGGTVTPV